MVLTIPPAVNPTRQPKRWNLRRPWNIDKDAMIYLFPEINTTWRDVSNGGNDGVITGATIQTKDLFPQCLLFDGIDDFVQFGDVCDITTGDATMEVVINCTSLTTTWQYCFMKGHIEGAVGAANQAYCFRIRNSKWEFTLQDDTTNSIVSSDAVLTVNTWYHFIALLDRSGDLQLYINGVKQASTADISGIGTLANANNLVMAAYSTNTSYKEFTGYIAAAGIYNRLLSPQEILNNYQFWLKS